MRDFYIYWCYSTFYMLIVSYRAYMGFIGYLCAYTPNRERKEHKQQEKKKEQKKEA